MEIVKFPANTTPTDLAENLAEYTRDGNVKWVVMVICEQEDHLRFEWSRLPNNLAAIGAVEFLKRQLMDQ